LSSCLLLYPMYLVVLNTFFCWQKLTNSCLLFFWLKRFLQSFFVCLCNPTHPFVMCVCFLHFKLLSPHYTFYISYVFWFTNDSETIFSNNFCVCIISDIVKKITFFFLTFFPHFIFCSDHILYNIFFLVLFVVSNFYILYEKTNHTILACLMFLYFFLSTYK
jgi:hypothetical protein